MTGAAKPVAVSVRCPLCDWESEKVPVDDDPMGRAWVAYARAEGAYGSHRATEHTPTPIPVLHYDDDPDFMDKSLDLSPEAVEMMNGPDRPRRNRGAS